MESLGGRRQGREEKEAETWVWFSPDSPLPVVNALWIGEEQGREKGEMVSAVGSVLSSGCEDGRGKWKCGVSATALAFAPCPFSVYLRTPNLPRTLSLARVKLVSQACPANRVELDT